MFDKATQRLVRRIDPDGELIAVSRVTDSEKLKPLAVVMKCPAMLPWQKAKYRPTVFTLNDLLQGETIQPMLDGIELLSYEEKSKGNLAGSLEAGVNEFNVSAQGSGASAISSSLGTLRKENVNMQKLIKDSKDRSVDLEHPLLQQKQGKFRSKQVFTLVMERVFTTSNCRIEYNNKEEGSFNTILKPLNIAMAQVSLKQSGSLRFDTDVSMEIPSLTVVAYGVRKLHIKNDSHYEISMWPDGFEADDFIEDPSYSEEEVDGILAPPEIREGSSLSSLKTELERVKTRLCVLAHLSHQSRSSLLLKFRQILLDRELLSTLEDKLDEMVYAGAPCLFQTNSSDSSDQFIETFLELLQSESTSENRLSTDPPGNEGGMMLSEQKQPVLTAMHILVSAAMGLTDDGLLLLEGFFSSQELNELNDLVNLLTLNLWPLPLTNLPAPLQSEDMLKRAERLFSSSNVVLKTEAEQLWAETKCGSGNLPFLLCTVIHGLTYLSETQK